MYLMKCGHLGTGRLHPSGKPICAICAGRTADAETIERECHGTEGLEGRTARCSQCGGLSPSRWELPFFEYKPNLEHDWYYNGCRGWD
jgi:hypothetical protein